MDTCIRVYNNGEEVRALRSGKDTEDWLEYNQTYRFGCALFVNGVCKYRGYLSEEQCKALEEKYELLREGSGARPWQLRTDKPTTA